MKKYLALLLVLVPILAGCLNQEPEQSQSTSVPVATLPPAYYDENSELEKATNGAVKQYSLPDTGYSKVLRIGNGLLLATDTETPLLRMLTGETCIPSASAQLDQGNLEQCQAYANGFVYYDNHNHSIRYLDSNLVQRRSVELEEDMTSPVIAPDGNTIYYCCGQEIRAMDVEKNISRLVKTQNIVKQTLVDIAFNGEMLICVTEDESGNVNTVYISAKDGQTIRTENEISRLYTNDECFLALWNDGVVQQWVCGSTTSTAQRLFVNDAELFDALEMGGVLGYSVQEGDLNLNFYALPSGIRTAQITLPEISSPNVIFADTWAKCIWLIADNPREDGKLLLRWDIKSSTVTDEAVYTDVLYTAENPDINALKELQSRAEQLNTKYGVRIRIWQDAVEVSGGHTLVAEHQTDTISQMLDQLETVLDEFPKKFVQKSISSRVRICLVRSVDGQSRGQQYWDGRYAFIALCSGSDIRADFLKGFGFVVDSHVLGNSPIYDYWDSLNPSGFRYGMPDESLLTGENPSFVDADSMISGMHDRSSVFYQAMMPDNAETFRTETMQKKLTMLCEAIRDAWRLEKKTDIYPWEQYLEESIAYKK